MSIHTNLRPGDVVGSRYRIIRLLGQGGMGSVFLAEDSRLPGKLWALKVLHTPWHDRSGFINEARFLAECSHPGLSAIADFMETGIEGTYYLVMEYIEGRTLEEILRREGGLAWPEAVRIAIELCEVLDYLHEGRPRPIIYRDLKPSNIMLDNQGRVRLIDFGTARNYDRTSIADTIHLGTLGFAAPEQLQGRQTDARTDLYTLGAVLFYLLSGGIFYERHSCKNSPARLEGVPEELQDLILKLLEEDPNHRHQRAKELLPILKSLRSERNLMQVDAPGRGAAATNKKLLIVLGSLSQGSGAGFVSLALSRILHRERISHALVEFPGIQADLYNTLFGEQKAPSGYRFPVETADQPLQTDGANISGKPWRNGYSEWVPLPPDRTAENWSPELTKRLLAGLAQEVVLLDVGTTWKTEATEDLCRQASLIFVVCGPSPVHMSRAEALQSWMRLRSTVPNEGKLHLIANRSIAFQGKEEWLRSMPANPITRISEFPASEVLSCLWKGTLVADKPRIAAQLTKQLEPIVALIRIRHSAPVVRSSFSIRLRRLLGLNVHR